MPIQPLYQPTKEDIEYIEEALKKLKDMVIEHLKTVENK